MNSTVWLRGKMASVTWPAPTNVTASRDHHYNDVASPRVTNTVVTQSSTEQLAQNNCITEKTLIDAKAVMPSNKQSKLYDTHLWSMEAVSQQLHSVDRSALEHCWRAVANRTIVRNRIPLEPTLFDHKCSFA
jgi:hypothetical protein